MWFMDHKSIQSDITHVSLMNTANNDVNEEHLDESLAQKLKAIYVGSGVHDMSGIVFKT